MSDFRDQLLDILGDCCPIPPLVRGRTPEVSVNRSVFSRLEEHWKKMTPDSRPQLHGVTVSRDKKRELRLLLSAGQGGRMVILSAELGEKMPALSEIWEYADWWEGELERFEAVSVEGEGLARQRGGVEWRPS